MFVLIDNSRPEIDVFFISGDGKNWEEIKFVSGGEGSLERSFEKMLKSRRTGLPEVRGLAVRVGSGRFTATRLAVTFANTLAMTLKIPVIAVEDLDTGGLAKKIRAGKGKLASARYSAEPRLGTKPN